MAKRLIWGALACAALGGCNPSDTDPGPGAATVGEARALEQAAEMLEEQRMPAEALEQDGATGTDSVPATETSD